MGVHLSLVRLHDDHSQLCFLVVKAVNDNGYLSTTCTEHSERWDNVLQSLKGPFPRFPLVSWFEVTSFSADDEGFLVLITQRQLLCLFRPKESRQGWEVYLEVWVRKHPHLLCLCNFVGPLVHSKLIIVC